MVIKLRFYDFVCFGKLILAKSCVALTCVHHCINV